MDAVDGSELMLEEARKKGQYQRYIKDFFGPNRLPIEDSECSWSIRPVIRSNASNLPFLFWRGQGTSSTSSSSGGGGGGGGGVGGGDDGGNGNSNSLYAMLLVACLRLQRPVQPPSDIPPNVSS